MIEINYTEPCNFEFEMQITGDATETPAVFFDVMSEGLKLSFEATHLENGVYQVSLPVLKKHLNSGSYKCDISVLLGEHLFTPLEDTLTLKEPPKPVVNSLSVKQTTPVKPTTIKIESFQAVSPKSKPIVEAPVKPAAPAAPKKPATGDENLFDMLIKKKNG